MYTPATSARWARRRRGPHRSAFTLIELLFVMMIIGVLVAVSLGALSAATSQARVERTRAIIVKLDQLVGAKYDSYKVRPVPIRVSSMMRAIGEPFQDTVADNDRTNGVYDGPPIRNVAPQEPFVDLAWYDANGDGQIDNLDRNGRYDWGVAEYRLLALRELMRLEMPNLKADVVTDPLPILDPLTNQLPLRYIIARPALSKRYYRRANSILGGIAAWTEQFEGAECLYLIVSAMRDGDDGALDFFAPSEIGDIDGDGMNEFLDAWGNPIEFVRWPTGYSENPGIDLQWGFAGQDDDPDGPGPQQADGIVDNWVEAMTPLSDDGLPPPTPQTRFANKAPDRFDPLKVDGRSARSGFVPNPFIAPFDLKPLIYSAGPDKEYKVMKLDFSAQGFPATALQLSDPYRVEFTPPSGPAKLSAGSPYDPDGFAGYADNITNHDFSE